MELEYLKIIITICLAVLGWLIAHSFTAKRDLKNKQREISITHLINAYRILTNDVSHRELTDERNEKLENILADIQLFGSQEQVELAKNLAVTVAAGGQFELDPLINSLRNNLRKELNLSKVEDNVQWLRCERRK
ncbi:hypothetical protein FA592_10380 [Sulfurospirillum diekertiae]|uniref:Uncharacterized protein n=1 Tax=Sulfurospirillum diekertiae TaxID=1854492 RepID=A0A6G9VST8_9BACT|nr:hypothetical protein [Sulfurospirillum diekertiae]QIR76606.1 hypothetical protein FA584_10530 [Sulfurospirillum diekertiae]QIR79235.1 hypothetical protein FA592_10380 [Sulfurospirillum diekertiae]